MNAVPRIICVSNRLPVSAAEQAGMLEFSPSSGGLVTAMAPILRKSRGIWIGSPGSTSFSDEEVSKTLAEFSAQSEFDLIPVALDQNSIAGFYQGFSNQIIWPLFHDLQTHCNFDPAFWTTYSKVQDVFKDAVAKQAAPGDLIWVHDFHLMGVGRSLRTVLTGSKLCFFLHIPFPSPDIFLKLPWRADVIDALLQYDLVGFQTKRDLKNFTECVEVITQNRCAARGALQVAKVGNRECLAGNFPISIDFNEFEDIAKLPEVESKAKIIRTDMNVEFLILSIDRLDYTKGIPYRIKAFKRLLEMEPSLKKRVALLQVVVPSRVEVPEYQQLRTEIEQLVSSLNGTHGEPGWVPVHHLFRSLLREDVIAMYRASDVALITPLKDGMNLVAKEYCASRINSGGSLILSEFAGSAEEFKGYVDLVNPYDIEGVAQALLRKISSNKEEDRSKMLELRDMVKRYDVFRWATSFLGAAGWNWHSAESAPRPVTVWERLKRIANVFDA